MKLTIEVQTCTGRIKKSTIRMIHELLKNWMEDHLAEVKEVATFVTDCEVLEG